MLQLSRPTFVPFWGTAGAAENRTRAARPNNRHCFMEVPPTPEIDPYCGLSGPIPKAHKPTAILKCRVKNPVSSFKYYLEGGSGSRAQTRPPLTNKAFETLDCQSQSCALCRVSLPA